MNRRKVIRTNGLPGVPVEVTQEVADLVIQIEAMVSDMEWDGKDLPDDHPAVLLLQKYKTPPLWCRQCDRPTNVVMHKYFCSGVCAINYATAAVEKAEQ